MKEYIKFFHLIFLLLCNYVNADLWPNGSKEFKFEENIVREGCGILASKIDVKEINYQELSLAIFSSASTDKNSDNYKKFEFFSKIMFIAIDLQDSFPVLSSIAVFDDFLPNAYAFERDLIGARNTTGGSIFLGRKLISTEGLNAEKNGGLLTFVMAHEFAHLYQYKLSNTLATHDFELQADYLAGWYLATASGKAKIELPLLLERLKRKKHDDRDGPFLSTVNAKVNIDLNQIDQFLKRKGESAFNLADNHGTSTQRIAAIRAGFEAGSNKKLLSQVYDDGLSFVAQLR